MADRLVGGRLVHPSRWRLLAAGIYFQPEKAKTGLFQFGATTHAGLLSSHAHVRTASPKPNLAPVRTRACELNEPVPLT